MVQWCKYGANCTVAHLRVYVVCNSAAAIYSIAALLHSPLALFFTFILKAE